MKRSILLLPLMVLLLSSINTNQTFAEASPPQEYWTIPELEEIGKEFDKDLEQLCGGDPRCEYERYFDLVDEKPEYRALDSYRNMVLMVTSINVETSTVKLLFHDSIPMTSRMMKMFGGDEPLGVVDEVFLAWFEREPARFNYDFFLTDDHDIETHRLFYGSTATNGEGWLPPNEEIEFKIDNAEYMLKAPHWIYYLMEGENTGVVGLHEYDRCFASPDYHEGMECRMVFTANTGYNFIPVATEAKSNPDLDREGFGGTESNELVIVPDNTTVENQTKEDEAQGNGAQEALSQFVAATPNTAIPPSPAKDDNINESPWAIIITISSLGLIVLWWFFFPIRKRH